jgi:hypothetical protein
MMRALIVLSLAGATAYMLIPAGERAWNAGESVSTARVDPPPQPRLPEGDRKLRSWGPTLKSLGRDSQGGIAAPQQPSTPSPLKREALNQPVSASKNQVSTAVTDNFARPVAATVRPAEAVQDAAHLAWVKVVHGAKAHSAASISSPITKFYPPGKELQILGRENGWIELIDPATQEHGYVFEQYLVAIDRPGPTPAVTHGAPAVMQASAEVRPAKVAAPKPQKPRFASRPVRQAVNEVRPEESALAASRRDRMARREDRRERKFFRFFGGRESGMEAWTVGSSR